MCWSCDWSCDYRYTDSEALRRQVQLYEEGLLRDREESAMPGGVDITDHHQLFSALFEKVTEVKGRGEGSSPWRCTIALGM